MVRLRRQYLYQGSGLSLRFIKAQEVTLSLSNIRQILYLFMTCKNFGAMYKSPIRII